MMAGRPKGESGKREQILAAARIEFGERGYDATTVRGIAAAARVDAAMINHYFGGKEQLFLATVDLPVDPATELMQVLTGPVEGLGERLLTRLLQVWDSAPGAAGIALLRTSMQHEWSARLLREFMLARVLRPVMSGLDGDPKDKAWRASLIASQVVGLILARHVIRLEPIASAARADLVRSIAPTIQRYLTDPSVTAG